jgi:hypothetical protein
MFFEFYNDKVRFELEKALIEIRDGKRNLTNKLYQEVEDVVLKELKKILLQKTDEVNVATLRSKLNNLLGLK